MSKTPEELAEDYGYRHYLTEDSGYAMRIAKDGFLAGYQAAKEHAHAALEEAEARIASLRERLADITWESEEEEKENE
jgi:hypothetical protein